LALFRINNDRLGLCKPTNFELERDLQKLVEANLGTVFNCRFVASEYSTGATHAGRIDTLALSEDSNPVILEYKKVESSELLNQGLYYLNWIVDHRGDFQIAVNKQLGLNVEVDWSDIRVICLAPGYKKYDLHAAQVMGANIELWQYRLYDDGSFYIEEVFRRSTAQVSEPSIAGSVTGVKNPVMVEAGRKAAVTRATAIYTIEEHLDYASEGIRPALDLIREFLLSIDDSVEENPKKLYIAYKTTQNLVCLEVKQHKIYLILKLNPAGFDALPSNARDVTNIGHYGTGDFELTINGEEDVEAAKDWVMRAYEQVGGS